MTKLILPAYRRNIRKACAACGNRVPNGYSTAIATNGDFVVYSASMGIVGCLAAGTYETFTKTSGKAA